MSIGSNCFVVLPPFCSNESIIFGRNSEDARMMGVAQEVCFYETTESLEGKENLLNGIKSARIILQKFKPGDWGGDCGSNEHNVSVGLTWSTNCKDEKLNALDIVRLVLATATDAQSGVECAGQLVTDHGHENLKFNLIICDSCNVWVISCANNMWAAQKLTEGYYHIPGKGLAVSSAIEMCSENLKEALTASGLWNGEGTLDFAACFHAPLEKHTNWIGPPPTGEGTYAITNMFETLRLAAKDNCSRSAMVCVLCRNSVSTSWFTATPNASESVFKPFVFAPQPKISPLTKVPPNSEVTLLHKLHDQRKPSSLEHLRALEAACVEELSTYLAEHPEVNEELDELMKDCVEAEVKFYR